jgi:hypothetical protein
MLWNNSLLILQMLNVNILYIYIYIDLKHTFT